MIEVRNAFSFLILAMAGIAGTVGCSDPADTSADAGLSDATIPRADGAPVVYADSCYNGVRDGDETHRDCGGSCPLCSNGAACVAPTDCLSGVCRNGYCLIPSCDDGVLNGLETQIDCGSSCGLCAPGTPCAANEECDSLVCGSDGSCADPACNDAVKNADETDVDCGGETCPACASMQTCERDRDCSSSVCGPDDVCDEPVCGDLVRNGTETDVDCGGDVCISCDDGGACLQDSDCFSGQCVGGSCISCEDGVQSGNESGPDCGGLTSCDRCEAGVTCTNATDCVSGICSEEGLCTEANCSDGVKNQDETDIDCGGPTCETRCGDTLACLLTSDCQSGVCNDLVCQVPTCEDGVKNGLEVDVDCGGETACPRCVDYKRCDDPTDCASGSCTTNICGTIPCTDFGMDTYGYRGCAVALAPVDVTCPDISAVGTTVNPQSSGSTRIDLGFSFKYYGVDYTSVVIYPSGVLGLQTASSVYLTYVNSCVVNPPTSSSHPRIYGLWDDLRLTDWSAMGGPPAGSIRYATVGTAPYRQFVVHYLVNEYAARSTGTGHIDFSIVLNESSNDVDICYRDLVQGDSSTDNAMSATIGIANGQAGTSFQSIQYSCQNMSVAEGTVLHFYHP